MEIEILKTDLDVFEKQAALMGVTFKRAPSTILTFDTSEFMCLELSEDGAPISALTSWRLATNFQLEIRRLTLDKLTSN